VEHALPFDQSIIQRILPHRYPFLFVDRVTEFEEDKRIVGIKNVVFEEHALCREPGQTPTLPWTILTEAVAQMGAILVLSKPANAGKLMYFMGIDHVHYRRPVYAGDQVEIEATVRRLRAKMGTLHGIARVNGEVSCEGIMTFALGVRTQGPTETEG
jgi:3-hydroxyacyl-[acyl-carrier-protein] dehydratase